MSNISAQFPYMYNILVKLCNCSWQVSCYLIGMSFSRKKLPLIQEEYKTEDNLIKGCQSKVWLKGEQSEDTIIFTADSDAILTKGIIAILIRVFSNQSAMDIINSDMSFIDEIGLKEHLSPTRANGLVSMIKNIKMYAIAFNAKA